MSAKNQELSERKKLILKTLVEAHIEGGEPVGSKYIMQNNLLSCSSATIRNEMALKVLIPSYLLERYHRNFLLKHP